MGSSGLIRVGSSGLICTTVLDSLLGITLALQFKWIAYKIDDGGHEVSHSLTLIETLEVECARKAKPRPFPPHFSCIAICFAIDVVRCASF